METLKPYVESKGRSAGLGSWGEIGQQLYKEFGDGKLDRVDFQGVPADEAQGAGYTFWRLDAARAAQEQTQACGTTPMPTMKTAANWIEEASIPSVPAQTRRPP